MSGHSKWKNNLNKKSAADAKRSVNFAKLSRAITLAAIEGSSPDPEINARLRMAIDKAKLASMPKDNIDRAIAKAIGPNKEDLTRMVLEVIAPHGVAIIALAATDNHNRTYGEIHSLVERNGGKLASSGSLRHLFSHCASLVIAPHTPEERVLELATLLNAEEIGEEDEGGTRIYFSFEKLGKAKEIIASSQTVIAQDPHEWYRPLSPVEVHQGGEEIPSHLLELLESHEEVYDLFTNVK